MKDYQIKIDKTFKNHPLHFRTEDVKELNKKEFLKLKRFIRKDKTCDYSIAILNGEKEPLLLSEKLQIIIEKVKKRLATKKTIAEMQSENTKREYYQKKYFWLIIIVTAILSSLITILIKNILKLNNV